jgi:hypothetical protein
LEDVIAAARPHLTNGEFQELEEIPTEYKGASAGDDEEYGRISKGYQRIDTGDARPTCQPPRRMPLAKQAEVNVKLDNMQRRGVIEESDGPWSFLVVLVRKENGEIRFCVDYRKLNDVTRRDCFPLSRIDDSLDTLSQ